jgi:hypothetical protein
MNERIKNLSKKAWLLAHEANDQAEEDEGVELTEAEFGNVFQQRFAELIVQESIVDFYRRYLDICSEEDITVQVERYVKEHFGVEE